MAIHCWACIHSQKSCYRRCLFWIRIWIWTQCSKDFNCFIKIFFLQRPGKIAVGFCIFNQGPKQTWSSTGKCIQESQSHTHCNSGLWGKICAIPSSDATSWQTYCVCMYPSRTCLPKTMGISLRFYPSESSIYFLASAPTSDIRVHACFLCQHAQADLLKEQDAP